MSNEHYSDGPSADNYGLDGPPPVLPPEEGSHERPTYERPVQERQAYGRPAYDGPPPERHRPPSYVRWIGGCLIVFVALLLLCGGGSAVLAAIAFNSTPATASVDKTISVSGVPNLIIHSNAGSVHVNPGSGSQITLHATKRVRAFTHAQAQSELDAISVTTTQSGDTVTIEVDNNGTFGPHFFDDRRVDLTLTAPTNTNLTVVENAGSLDATGLTGKLSTQVNAGSVTLDNIAMADGSSLRVNAGSLSVNGTLQAGASVSVNVSAGSADLTLPRDTSAHVDASATAGNVSVNGWNVAESHNGANDTVSGDLNPNPTGTITIRVSAGSASLNAA